MCARSIVDWAPGISGSRIAMDSALTASDSTTSDDRLRPIAADRERCGRVAAVRGNVVDVRFKAGLPARLRALRTGADEEIVLEVESHVSTDVVRCIALTPTAGLARGTPVRDTGAMLEVPVGQALLGRMLDVFGRPIDGGTRARDDGATCRSTVRRCRCRTG